jgi:two-component system cell cycle response regulator DivK
MTTILVVEDEPSIRTLLERRLVIARYQVITACDGAEAIEQAHTEQPALIVMDMGMPIMNGWQAADWLKARPATRAIPIIALTAFAMPEDRVRCIAAGCNEYETKPIDFPRLFQKISALLDRVIANSR